MGGDDDLLLRGGNGRGHGRGGAGGPHDLNEFVDGVRSGKAFGLERSDPRIAAAKERYRGARGTRNGSARLALDVAAKNLRLSEKDDLLARLRAHEE